MNTIETFENNKSVRLRLEMLWRTREGNYLYMPDENDYFSLRLFKNKETLFENDVEKDENGELTAVFPDNFTVGDYEFEVLAYINQSEKPETVTSGKFHVARR